MTKLILKSVSAFAIIAALMFGSLASSALAQGRHYHRSYENYQRDRNYDYQRSRDYGYDQYDPYYDSQSERNKRAWKRTGIGAAIGAAGGGLMGGRKGVVIGGLVGAAGGYIYHRSKENNRRY